MRSPKTGNPRRLSETTREVVASIPTSSPRPSSTTGPAAVASERNDRRGIVPLKSGVIATPAADERIVRHLDLPEAAASLVQLCASVLAFETTGRYGSHGFEGVQIDARPRPIPTDLTGDALDRHRRARRALAVEARSALDPLLRPMTGDQAVALLAELSVLTKRRTHDADDDELTIAAYARRLARFPLDVGKSACEARADSETFWPAWVELLLLIERRMRGREAICRALDALLAEPAGE
jgi:hypothetical protein